MDAAALMSIPFLVGVPEAELTAWAAAAESRVLERRRTVVNSGEAHPDLFLVRSGLVLLCLETRAGDTRMTAIAGPEQCFNLQCLHPNARATESAHALTDAEVVAIPGALARGALRRGGVLAARLGAFAAGRLVEVTDDFIRATTLDVRGRTAVALLRLSDRLQSPSIPLSQQQISGLVGTRRETLALALAELRQEDVIDTRYRMIKILNREELIQAAECGYPSCIEHGLPVPLVGCCDEPEAV